jgi:hypothetical protein
MSDCPRCHQLLGRRKNPDYDRDGDINRYILDCADCGYTELTPEDTWQACGRGPRQAATDLSWWWGIPGERP